MPTYPDADHCYIYHQAAVETFLSDFRKSSYKNLNTVLVNTTDLETNDAKPEDEDLNLDEPTDLTTMHE